MPALFQLDLYVKKKLVRELLKKLFLESLENKQNFKKSFQGWARNRISGTTNVRDVAAVVSTCWSEQVTDFFPAVIGNFGN